MERIAIVSSQYFWFPDEPGPSRFYYIAKLFADNGFDVDVFTSSFEHHAKESRKRLKSEMFNVHYIDVPKYKKNIDIKREMGDKIFAAKILKMFKKVGARYDAVYCSLPPNSVSKVLGKYCKKIGTPFIADIEDLWPEGMERHFPKALRFILYPYHVDAEKTYKYVDAVVGTSEEYSLRASRYNGRNIPYRTVYVGCDVDAFDREVNENLDKVKKPEGEIWLTYAGSIGHSYAIDNLVRVAKILQDKGENRYRFKILGSGPLKDQVEKLSNDLGCKNVDFLGYVTHPIMVAYLVKSDILINSFAKGVSQSIVNKIGDYLAAGKPMINTLENEEMRKLVNDYGIGVNVAAENEEELISGITKLLDNKDMNEKARELAENKFDRKNSYKEIIKLLHSVMKR